MLLTGSKIAAHGFTLIEVIVTVAILSLGVVLIFEAFFISLDSFNYYSNYLNVASWADEQIWETQKNLNYFGSEEPYAEQGGSINRNNRDFRWDLAYSLISSEPDLYEINLELNWQEGRRAAKLSRTAYAIYDPEEDENTEETE